MVGMALTFAWTSGSALAAERLRSVHGFRPTPQKPPLGNVIWNVNWDSGIDIAAWCTARVEGTSWSSVEFDGVLTTPKITPWSSVGASSFGACVNMRNARIDRTIHAV